MTVHILNNTNGSEIQWDNILKMHGEQNAVVMGDPFFLTENTCVSKKNKDNINLFLYTEKLKEYTN
jgi:hypothetical protein